MNKSEICSYISLISESLLSISLIYFKLKKYYIISFNSFYLLIFNIITLKIFHFIYFINTENIYLFYFPLLIVFQFSYILRIKRIIDCLSLSKILKSQTIKNKVKALSEKFNYSLEIFYFIYFIILSISAIILFYLINQINIKQYILLIITIIILSYSCFRISVSDMRKKLKRNYILEIILYLLLFSSLNFNELNIKDNFSSYNNILIFIFEILYLLLIAKNCGIIFSKPEIKEDKFIVNEKLKSDFDIFFNNELCFYAFNSYLNKDEQDSKIFLTLYLEIKKYKMKIILNEKDNNDIKNIIEYYENKKQYIKNYKEKIEKIFEKIKDEINANKYGNNIFDNLFFINRDLLNKKFGAFKKTYECKTLFSFINLISFLDEFIFVESFYFDYTNNEEL